MPVAVCGWIRASKANVNEELKETIARASIINFLNELVDIWLLNYMETTGKGVHRRVYISKYSES